MRCSRRPFSIAGLGLAFGPRFALALSDLRGSGIAITQRREIGAFGGLSPRRPFAVVLRPAQPRVDRDRRRRQPAAADRDPVARLGSFADAGDRRSRTTSRVDPRTPVVVTVDYVRLGALARRLGQHQRRGAQGGQARRVDRRLGIDRPARARRRRARRLDRRQRRLRAPTAAPASSLGRDRRQRPLRRRAPGRRRRLGQHRRQRQRTRPRRDGAARVDRRQRRRLSTAARAALQISSSAAAGCSGSRPSRAAGRPSAGQCRVSL